MYQSGHDKNHDDQIIRSSIIYDNNVVLLTKVGFTLVVSVGDHQIEFSEILHAKYEANPVIVDFIFNEERSVVVQVGEPCFSNSDADSAVPGLVDCLSVVSALPDRLCFRTGRGSSIRQIGWEVSTTIFTR